MAAVAAHKGISLEKISVDVQRQTAANDPSWYTHFTIRLDLGRDLPPRVRAIMLGSAGHCEVHKLLTGALHFDCGWAATASRVLGGADEA